MTTEPTQTSSTATTEAPSLVSTATETVTTAPATEPQATTTEPTQTETQTQEFTPIAFDAFQVPEGIEFSPEQQTEFLGILNNQELSATQKAQELMNMHSAAAQAASEAGSQAWADLQTNWQNEVRTDSALGGANLEGTLTGISKVIDQHGSPELREVFNTTGAGNNIHMIRFLHNISQQLNEGSPVTGAPADTPKTAAETLYGGKK